MRKLVHFETRSGTVITETTSASDAAIKLRALALGWFVISIEQIISEEVRV